MVFPVATFGHRYAGKMLIVTLRQRIPQYGDENERTYQVNEDSSDALYRMVEVYAETYQLPMERVHLFVSATPGAAEIILDGEKKLADVSHFYYLNMYYSGLTIL